jgi:hypothetical protein
MVAVIGSVWLMTMSKLLGRGVVLVITVYRNVHTY